MCFLEVVLVDSFSISSFWDSFATRLERCTTKNSLLIEYCDRLIQWAEFLGC